MLEGDGYFTGQGHMSYWPNIRGIIWNSAIGWANLYLLFGSLYRPSALLCYVLGFWLFGDPGALIASGLFVFLFFLTYIGSQLHDAYILKSISHEGTSSIIIGSKHYSLNETGELGNW